MSEATHDRNGGGFFAIAAVVMLLIAYPLSLGPAILVHPRCGPTAQGVIEAVYLPLQFLHENTPLRKPLDWYVSFWQ